MIVTETQRILFGGREERHSEARQGKRRAALGWPLRLSIKGEPSWCPSLRTPRLSGREEVSGRVRFPLLRLRIPRSFPTYLGQLSRASDQSSGKSFIRQLVLK